MAKLARRTPTTLHEFMDREDDYVNAEDTLKTLTNLSKSEVEQADKN